MIQRSNRLKDPSANSRVLPNAIRLALALMTLQAAETATAQTLCGGIYRPSNPNSASSNSISPKASSTELLRTLPIAGRYSFESILKRDRQIEMVVQSPNERFIAIVHSGKAPLLIDVIDLQTGQTFFSEGFTNIKTVSFIPNSDLIAISGTKTADGRVAKLYVLPLSKTTAKTEASRAENPSGSLMESAMRFWLSPLLSTPSTSAQNPETALKLPGSPNFGVGVKQVVARQDLRSVFVVQDSSNALKTVFLPDARPGSDPYSSLLNQGVSLFDPVTMQPTGSLSYGPLTPVDMTLNPQSRLAALSLVDPIVAHKKQNNVIIVDTDQPQKPLYTYHFQETGVEHVYSRYTMGEDNRISTQWSPDGKNLFITESTAGSVIKYDLEKQRESASERNGGSRWPISGSAPLSDGSLLVLRQGDEPSELNAKLPPRVFGYISKSIESFDHPTKPDFELKFDGNPALFSRYYSNNHSDRIKAQAVIEMQKGRMIVVVLDGQVIAIDREHPQDQITLNPPPSEHFPNLPNITSVQKLNEGTLRLSDREHGVFDIRIGEPR